MNWHTHPWISFPKFQHAARTIINSQKVISKSQANWPMYDRTLCRRAGTSRESTDQTYHEQSTRRLESLHVNIRSTRKLTRCLKYTSEYWQFCHAGDRSQRMNASFVSSKTPDFAGFLVQSQRDVHTLTCCAHIFLLIARAQSLAARVAQGCEKGLLHAHVVDLHLAFSTLMFHLLSLLFLRVTSRPPSRL